VLRDKPTPMYRHYPTINNICEPLLGSPVYSLVGVEVEQSDGSKKVEQVYKIVGVKYPTWSRRHAIYREAMELVNVLRHKSDFFNLAVYRRQVTVTTGIPLDELFIIIGDALDISRKGWEDIAVRMPKGTWVHKACLHRAATGRISREQVT
jgi:hypothetical protein